MPDFPESHYYTIPPAAVDMITGLKGMDPWHQQLGDAKMALIIARQAMERAVSYRGFRIGSCVQRLMSPTYQVGFSTGANNTPLKGGVINVHAEEPAVTDIEARDGIVSVLALVGDVQADDTSGLSAETIVPCAVICLPMLQASLAIVDRTVIVSATPDLRTVQIYDTNQLATAHDTGRPDGFVTSHFETSFADDPESWDGEYLFKIAGPLLERRFAAEQIQ